MSLPNLLVVDDDVEFLKSQSLALQNRFKVVVSQGVHESLEILKHTNIDCALIDFYLNDGSGHDIAKWLAENQPWCPVVLISAGVDKKMALDSFPHRVFDILEKPFGIDSVVAKLDSALREFAPKKKSSEAQRKWHFDKDRRVFRYEDTSVLLTQTEVRILQILIAADGGIVSREKMIEELWGELAVAGNTLDTHLTNLRKKAPFLKSLIRGVRGVGYVLEV